MTRGPKTADVEARAYHHGDLRNALIIAAAELIEEKGVDGFAMVDAESAAGVDSADMARELCPAGLDGEPLDGLLFVHPPSSKGADGDCRMVIINADGSRPEACGNVAFDDGQEMRVTSDWTPGMPLAELVVDGQPLALKIGNRFLFFFGLDLYR